MEKEILKRHIQDMLHKTQFAKKRTEDLLPIIVYRHNSLIRRRLGNVNMQLQENKATNLALAVKHIDGLVIHPGETFSVWKLVGRTTEQKGYKEGLTIAKGKPSQGIGGGMCQLSNLIPRTIISTIGFATTPRTPINSTFGQMTNTCAVNCEPRYSSPTPSTSMPRTNTFHVRTEWSIATVRSIATSSTVCQASVLKANSSAPTMPE